MVNPSTMSNKWKYGKSKKVVGGVHVAAYVKAGGKYYKLLRNNCHHATARMCKIKG